MNTNRHSHHGSHQRTQHTLLAGLLLAAITAFASTTTRAQTAPPTPQSVAPGYTPPAAQTYDTYGRPQSYIYVPTRAGTWDLYLTVGYNMYDSSKINNTSIYDPVLGVNRVGNLKFDFDDTYSFGFGFDYNLNEHLAIGAQFEWAQPDYDATFQETTGPTAGTVYRLSGEANVYTGDAFVQYNFTTGKLVPFVRGSVGFAWIDTGIPTGPTEYYWFWDYWWGGSYVVGETPTKSETYLTLGASAGLKYDFGNHVFLTAAYTARWANTPHDWTMIQSINVSVGWNY